MAAAENQRLLVPDALERGDDLRAELRAGMGLDLVDRGANRAPAAIRAVARQGVEGVRDEHDPRREWDFVAREPVRVAPSIDPLVARASDLEHEWRELDP